MSPDDRRNRAARFDCSGADSGGETFPCCWLELEPSSPAWKLSFEHYQRVLAAPVRDDGFVLVAGRTQRDYQLLFEAVRELPYPVIVLEYRGPNWKKRSGQVRTKSLPKNIRIVGHDGAQDTWLDWLVRARIVLLPIRAESITPSGISTYLQAIALGKCVVMTRGGLCRSTCRRF